MPIRVEAKGERGTRLDQFLARELAELSRSRIQALIDEGHVLVDGVAATAASFRLKGAEQIDVEVPPLEPSEPEAEDLPVSVVYQDADVLVLDKAAGMVVHPGAGHASGTLVNALLHHISDLTGVGGVLRPGLVHRLDRTPRACWWWPRTTPPCRRSRRPSGRGRSRRSTWRSSPASLPRPAPFRRCTTAEQHRVANGPTLWSSCS